MVKINLRMDLIEEVEKVLDDLKRLKADGIKISAKPNLDFVVVIKKFSHLTIPPDLVEKFNEVTSTDKKKIEACELKQLLVELKLHKITIPASLRETVAAWESISAQNQSKKLRSDLSKLKVPREVLYLKVWIKNLCEQVQASKKNEFEKSLKYFHTLPYSCNLSDFFDLSGGLKKASERVRVLLNLPTNLVLEDKEKDFLIDMYFAINLIEKFIEAKYSNTIIPDKFELCVLCWRRVRPIIGSRQEGKQSFQIEQSKTWGSNSYCPMHHSKKNVGTYKSHKKALVRAALEEQDEIKKGNLVTILRANKSLEQPNVLNRLLLAFAEPLPLSKQKGINEIPWPLFINQLSKQVNDCYPKTYELIKSIDWKTITSLAFLFTEVLKKVDGSDGKEESQYWRLVSVNEWIKDDKVTNGRRVLIHMLRRHEAYLYYSTLKRRRGPEKQEFRAHTTIQKCIVSELNLYEGKGEKADIRKIAAVCKTSEKNVYSVKSKLKKSSKE